MKNRPFVNAFIFAFFFITVWVIISYFKGWSWNHPMLIIFVPIWTIMLMWVVVSMTKKMNKERNIYLPESIAYLSPEYNKRLLYWKQYIHEKATYYIRLFAWMCVAMSALQIIAYYDDGAGVFLINYYGIAALLAFITITVIRHLSVKAE